MNQSTSRRRFLKKTAAASAAFALPTIIPSSALGRDGAVAPSERINLAGIGMGGQGRGDLDGFVNFPQVQGVAVCDVVGRHCQMAKDIVDRKNGMSDCKMYRDFRDVLERSDVDAVLIGTPDHWHVPIAVEAMKRGKDVYSEKPETLTINQGKELRNVVRQTGRVYSGGSQRVWGDYNWFHKMVRGGALGDVTDAWANVGGPSGPCYLEPQETPDDIDWNMWLGPAPWRPFHKTLITGGFRPFRDYSGGGTTDWGCHTFGGCLFALDLHLTGPTEITPPNDEVKNLVFKFASGQRIHHGGGWGGIINFRGSEGEISEEDRNAGKLQTPDIYIPNYKGSGGIFGDFLHCVKTREQPFRHVEAAHRTATCAHLANIAYWLNRPLKWDPKKEDFVGDPEASRWLDRPARDAWQYS
ncbi:MAG: Gfo/Idh/MocA family oxidoreductase [Planctomycetota bacterium]